MIMMHRASKKLRLGPLGGPRFSLTGNGYISVGKYKMISCRSRYRCKGVKAFHLHVHCRNVEARAQVLGSDLRGQVQSPMRTSPCAQLWPMRISGRTQCITESETLGIRPVSLIRAENHPQYIFLIEGHSIGRQDSRWRS